MSGFGSLNRVHLIGRLGQNPDVRYTASGVAVANFSVATEHSFLKDDVWQRETTWHKVVVWGKQVDFVKNYFTKGLRVYVEGRLENHEWEDQQGEKRYRVQIRANDVQIIDYEKQGDGGAENPMPKMDAPAAAPEEDDRAPDDVPF